MKIEIRTEWIRLDQLLKLADVVGGGGEAKVRIQQGEVMVDSETEVRRGRKIRVGQSIEIDGAVIEVVGEGG